VVKQYSPIRWNKGAAGAHLPLWGEDLETLRRQYPVGATVRFAINGVLYEGKILQVAECFPCRVWDRSGEEEKLVPAIRRYMCWMSWTHKRGKDWIEMRPITQLHVASSEEVVPDVD
jgi:hypothetical protein